jgi:putative methanogenesis marker 16 metalloprotein
MGGHKADRGIKKESERGVMMVSGGKTVREINDKLIRGEAVIMTAQEFKNEVRAGTTFRVEDVDVVTMATKSVMSGTAAMMHIPFGGRGEFLRVKRAWLNGVPAYPGPAPNERLGMADVMVYGTDHSIHDPYGYGGGHLFRDMVEGKEIHAECESIEGRYYESTFTLDELDFARIYTIRNAFSYYMSVANIKNHPSYRENPSSIFAFRPMPVGSGLTMSGTGELNPLQNDRLKTIRVGTKVLVNKAPGVVVGCGTRSTVGHEALSVVADMFDMDPEFMGGFKTSFGPEVVSSVAIPIPVLDEELVKNLCETLDENIPLPFADIGDRIPITQITYADIWKDAELEMEFDADKCMYCSFTCAAEYYCPMGAILWKDREIDDKLCVRCGACAVNCPGGAFKGKGGVYRGNMGEVYALNHVWPIIFRQSDRYRALLLADYLKELMETGEFLLSDTDLEIKIRGKL